MDGSQFCCCGLRHKCTNSELNDESRFAETHCSVFGKSRPLRISHTIWKRNSLTCKPWRRKSLLQVILTRTCSQALFWFKLLILVTSVFQGILNVWQWTTSAKSRILLVILIGGLRLPLASCQESLQPSLSDRHQLFDQVVYVGSMFSYTLFERAFDCKVDTLVVTEASDRFLSHWLAYNEKKKQLYGVPSHKDKGTYDILVVALAKDERVRGQVCGSKSFSITVLPLSEELPISVYAVGASHDYGQKSVPNVLCTPGVQVILGTVILDTHLQNLNGHERVKVIVKMAKHLNVDSNKLKLFSGEVSHPLIEQLDSPVVMAAGAGDGRFNKGPRTLLTWNIGCGAMKLEGADLSILEVNAQDGTITDLLGFHVVGWHIMSGSQKSVVKHHRFRRQVGVQATPTPTMSSLLPTHISTISTSVIVSKSVTPSLSTYSTSSSISLFKSSMDVSSRTQDRSDVQSSSNVTRGVSSQVSSSPVPSSPISMTIISLTVNGSSPLQSANRTTATVISSAEGFTVNSTVLVSPSVITSPSLSSTITLSRTTIFTSTSTSPPVSTTVFTTGSPLVSTPNSTVELVSSTDRLSSMNRTTTLFTPSGAISSVSNVTSVIPVTNINSSMVTMTTFSHPSTNTTVNISSSSLPANQTVILSTSFTPALLSSTTVSPSQNSSGGFTNSSVPQTSTVSTMSGNLRSTSNSSATLKTTGSFLSVTSLVSNVTSLSTSRSVNLSASLPLTTSLSSARLSSKPSIQSSFETIVTNSSISLGPSNSSALKRTFTISLSSFLVPSLSTPAVSSQSSFENSSTIMSSTLPALNTTVVNTASTISTTVTSSMQQSLKITSYTVLQSVNKSSSREITSMKPSVSTQLPSASSLVENSTSAPNSTIATVIFTRTTLQPSTQSSSVVIILSSPTSSPLITSVNVTSLVKSLNTSIAKSTAQVNSTSLVDKPSLFSPTLTSGTRTFTTTPATNRSVVATTQGSIGKSSAIVSSPLSLQTADFTITPNLTSTFLVAKTTPSFTGSTVNITRSVDSTVISPNVTAKSTIEVLNSTVSPVTAGNLSSSITGQASLSSNKTQTVLSSSTGLVSTRLVVNSTVVYSDTNQPEVSDGTRTLFHSTSFTSSSVLAVTTALTNATMFFSPSTSSPRISPSSFVTFVENSTLRSSIVRFLSSGVSSTRSFSKSSSSLFEASTVVASGSSTNVPRNSTAQTFSVATSPMPNSPMLSSILTSNTPSSNTSAVPSRTPFTYSLSSALFSSSLLIPGNSTDRASGTMGVVTTPEPSSPVLGTMMTSGTLSRRTSTVSSTHQFTSLLSSELASSLSYVLGNSTVPVSRTMTVTTSPLPSSPVVSILLTARIPSQSTSSVPSTTQFTSLLSTKSFSSSLSVLGNSTVPISSMSEVFSSELMTSRNGTTLPNSSMMNSTSTVVYSVTRTVSPSSATLPSRSRLVTVSGGVTVSPSPSFTINTSASSFSSMDVSVTVTPSDTTTVTHGTTAVVVKSSLTAPSNRTSIVSRRSTFSTSFLLRNSSAPSLSISSSRAISPVTPNRNTSVVTSSGIGSTTTSVSTLRSSDVTRINTSTVPLRSSVTQLSVSSRTSVSHGRLTSSLRNGTFVPLTSFPAVKSSLASMTRALSPSDTIRVTSVYTTLSSRPSTSEESVTFSLVSKVTLNVTAKVTSSVTAEVTSSLNLKTSVYSTALNSTPVSSVVTRNTSGSLLQTSRTTFQASVTPSSALPTGTSFSSFSSGTSDLGPETSYAASKTVVSLQTVSFTSVTSTVSPRSSVTMATSRPDAATQTELSRSLSGLASKTRVTIMEPSKSATSSNIVKIQSTALLSTTGRSLTLSSSAAGNSSTFTLTTKTSATSPTPSFAFSKSFFTLNSTAVITMRVRTQSLNHSSSFSVKRSIFPPTFTSVSAVSRLSSHVTITTSVSFYSTSSIDNRLPTVASSLFPSLISGQPFSPLPSVVPTVSTASQKGTVSSPMKSAIPSSSLFSQSPLHGTSRTTDTLNTGSSSSQTVKSVTFTSGTLPSSFVFPSSNFTPTSTVTNATKTIVPTSTAIPNSAPTVYNNIARLTAPAGKALYYTIPEDTFYDKEDQANTRKLALTVSFADGTAIPPDFWLQFDNETQTIYGLPMNTHVPSGISGIEFVMRARDSRGAVAYDAFEVLVISSDSAVVQKLTVRFSNDFEDFSSNVSQRLLLLQKIAEYYGDSDMSALRVSAFTSGSVVMTWSNDTLPTDTCDEEKVQYVKDKIFLPSGEIREEFKAALEGFPAENGNHQLLGVCNDSAVIPPATFAPLKDSSSEGDLWFKLVLVGVIIVLLIIVLACLLVWHLRRKRPKPLQPEKRTYRKRKPIVLDQEIEMKPISGKPIVLPDDDPSHPPSYLSETSLNKPWNVSDDEDEVDYGKRPPPIYREHSPQSYSEPRDSPPPVYMLPPMYEGSYC